MHRAWTCCASDDAAPVLQALIEPLRALGVADDGRPDERALADIAEDGPVALIAAIARIDEPCCETLRALARRCGRRALAVVREEAARERGDLWRLLEAGAEDVIVCHDPTRVARQIVARLERWEHVERLLCSETVRAHLIGSTPTWRSLLRRVVEVAHFTDDTVLLVGETGTGKELVARLIHTLDRRKRRPELVVVDCTTLSTELLGSELFGHARGAFTGAVGPRPGAVELAHEGTLFLDEIGELPPPLQPKLLRVLQERSYKPVGGDRWRRSDFRLLGATNRALDDEVAAGRFRADLYYRVASWEFRLPPLAQRRDDVLPLAEHFLGRFGDDGPPPELDPAVKAYLLTRPFPGNVRQLEHLMRQIAHRHVGSGPITVGDIPEHERPERPPAPSDWQDAVFDHAVHRAIALGADLRAIGDYTKDTAIRLAVNDTGGNLQQAAKRLGVTDRTLQLRRAGRRVQQRV